MSHDKIKSATRERMTVTGEPYAAARREVMREYQAASRRDPLPSDSMLLWINGPCGVGKTATAFELNRRLPGSVVCDPEHVGYGMRRMLPRSLKRRWQDIPAWRHAVSVACAVTASGCTTSRCSPSPRPWCGGCVPAALAGSPGLSRGKPRSSTSGRSSFADPSSRSTFTPITGTSRKWPTPSPARRDWRSRRLPTARCVPGCIATQRPREASTGARGLNGKHASRSMPGAGRRRTGGGRG